MRRGGLRRILRSCRGLLRDLVVSWAAVSRARLQSLSEAGAPALLFNGVLNTGLLTKRDGRHIS